MLRATEQLTWTAKLDRFKRGCDDSRPAGPGRDHTETGAWQNFSGSHLTCKVIFTKPIDKPWPSSHNTASQESTPGAKPEPSVDRQLRIMVECEEDLNFSSGNAALTDHGGAASSQLPSASQPTSRLTLLDVDLVRINKAYFHTEHRLKAVVVRRQDQCVLIRMLDEREPAKARRAQLEFSKEADVETFLSLIEPDSTLLAGGSVAAAKKEKSKGKEKVDSLSSTKAESSINGPSKAAQDSKAVVLEASQPESQSQSLGEKLLQLNQTRLSQPPAPPATTSNPPFPSQSQPSNRRLPPASCPQCAPSHAESTFATPTAEADAFFPGSSSDDLVDVYSGQTSTPLTEPMQFTELADDGAFEAEEEVDDGLDGWPDPSAVECIHDDVRTLCLADPNLEWVIACCVDEHLQDLEAAADGYR